MKHLKLVLAMALALCLVLALCACTPAGEGDADPENSDPVNSVVPSDDGSNGEGENAPNGTLVMATNAEFPPYEYQEGGEIIGIDVEIAEAIAAKLGKTLEISDMKFNSIIAAVQSGKADIGVAGLTVTEDRLKNIDFTDTYATSYQVIIVKEGSDIEDADGLEGKTIGVQENTTGDIFTTDDFGDDAISRYNMGTEAVLALTQDKVDAVVIDKATAEVFVSQNTGLVILPTEYVVEYYAIAVSKDNPELTAQINEALQELKDDGTLQAIIDKYITP